MRVLVLLVATLALASAHFSNAYLKGNFVYQSFSDIDAGQGDIISIGYYHFDGEGGCDVLASIGNDDDVTGSQFTTAATDSCSYWIGNDGSGKMNFDLVDATTPASQYDVHITMISKDHFVFVTDQDTNRQSSDEWHVIGEAWKQTYQSIAANHPYVFAWWSRNVDTVQVSKGHVTFYQSGDSKSCHGEIVRDEVSSEPNRVQLDQFEQCIWGDYPFGNANEENGQAAAAPPVYFVETHWDITTTSERWLIIPVDREFSVAISYQVDGDEFNPDNDHNDTPDAIDNQLIGKLWVQTTSTSKSSDSSISTFYSSSSSSDDDDDSSSSSSSSSSSDDDSSSSD